MKIQLLKKTQLMDFTQPLSAFESGFTYPLGDKTFTIEHGTKAESYFDFFNSLGEPNVFVISQPPTGAHNEENASIQGAGCAVLRELETKQDAERFWYLCDFKLDKEVRGRGLLTKMALKYTLSFYRRCPNFVAVNMSPMAGNKLIEKVRKLFFFMKVSIRPLYFYEWTESEYQEIVSRSEMLQSMALYTNYGSKDIVIENKIKPIIHLVNAAHATTNLDAQKILSSDKAEGHGLEDPMYMFATHCKVQRLVLEDIGVTSNYEGTMISHGVNMDYLPFSSAEI